MLAAFPLTQGSNEGGWRLGQEASLAPPRSNLRSFGTEANALHWSSCDIVGTFWRPRQSVVIRRPGKCVPLDPLVTPLLWPQPGISAGGTNVAPWSDQTYINKFLCEAVQTRGAGFTIHTSYIAVQASFVLSYATWDGFDCATWTIEFKLCHREHEHASYPSRNLVQVLRRHHALSCVWSWNEGHIDNNCRFVASFGAREGCLSDVYPKI